MIYVGFPWQAVPAWLERMFPTPGHEHEAKVGTMCFGSVVIVWTWRGQYFASRLVNFGCVIVIKDCEHVTIQGQHPSEQQKPVIIYCDPIVPDWIAAGITAGLTLAAVWL